MIGRGDTCDFTVRCRDFIWVAEGGVRESECLERLPIVSFLGLLGLFGSCLDFGFEVWLWDPEVRT